MKKLCPLIAKLPTILLVLFVNTTLNSQEIKFENLTIKDGLSQNSVKCIFQDSRGYIWLGTEDGLNRYDGYSFKVFRSELDDSTSLSDNIINSVFEDRNNNLWVVTSTGSLNKFNRNTGKFKRYMIGDQINLSGVPFDATAHMYEDKDNNLWAYNMAVYKYLPEKDKFKQIEINLENNGAAFTVFYQDSDNLFWIGTRDGLYNYNLENGSFQRYVPDNFTTDLLGNVIFSIIEDKNGIFWIGTNRGLYKFDKQKRKFIQNWQVNNQSAKTAVRTEVTSIIDSKEFLWMTWQNWDDNIVGISKFNKKTTEITAFTFSGENSLSPSNNVAPNIFEDMSGVMWIGTFNKGLFRFEKEHKFETKLEKNVVCAFLEEKDGTVWVATANNKLYRYNKNTGAETEIPIDILQSPINIIAQDHTGSILLGTYMGLYRISIKDKNSNSPQYELLLNDKVKTILEDKQHRIWTGNEGSLCIYDPKDKSKLYFYQDDNNPNTLTSNSIESLTIDHTNGNVWVGTWDGLNLFELPGNQKITHDNVKITHFKHQSYDTNTITENKIISLCFDRSGKLWAGTYGGGLNSIEINKPDNSENITYTIKNYTIKNGLPNNVVYGILCDNHNNIWASTNEGLSMIDNSKGEIKNYFGSDGLQSNQFFWRSSYQGPSGKMYFGGLNGYNAFFADSINFNTYIPPVKITGFSIFNKPIVPGAADSILKYQIDETKEITIDYDQSVFSFDFVALNYLTSEKNQYAYILEGFDKDWHYVGTQRNATYTNLDPGRYIFRVIASNNDGFWNETGTSLILNITPPFWMTWWFRTLAVITLIVMLVSFYLIRVKALKEQKRILEIKVDERTRDLQNANFELKEQKEEILAQNEEIQQQSEEIMTQRDALEEQNKLISRSYQRIEMLSDFGQKLTSTLALETINKLLYEYVSNLIEMDAFGIGRYFEELNQLVFTNFIEDGKPIKSFYKKLDDPNSLSVYCFKNQEAIYINDIEKEYSNYVPSLNKTSTSQTAFSRIHIPLTVENKRIGIFIVNSYKKDAYSPEDFTNLKTLASYISIALDNANAYRKINEINRNVEESINYAQSIQSAFLPTKSALDKFFKNFVIYKPKDIVSGDFYWFSPLEKDETKPLKFFVAAADCTGHGVPGALISIIGNNLLNEIVTIRKIHNPAQILEFLNVEFQLALNQDQSQNNDGMDMVLYYVEEQPDKKFKVVFAGAKNPCIYYNSKSDKIEFIKGSRKSIGGIRSKRSTQFYEAQEFTLQSNDIIYLISDGFIDQLNIDKERFSRTRFVEMLEKYKNLPVSRQKQEFEKELNNHQKNEKQTDDITFIGIKL